jgi:uncharacterized protein YcbK (DUF882 family)
MRISENITYAEAFKSQQAARLKIKNTTNDPEILKNMKHVADNVFEPIRKHFGLPIGISSFYRSPKLNEAIKGSSSSQHMTGEAIDIDADIFGGLTNKEIFDFAKENLEYDQLIWEFGTTKNPSWVHVSLKRNGKNRKQILYIK